MPSARHLAPVERAPHRLRLLLTVTAATVLTGGVVALSVTSGSGAVRPEASASLLSRTALPATVAPVDPLLADRAPVVSRSARRVTIHRLPRVIDVEFRTAALNLWPAPKASGKPLAVLPEGGRVRVTGVRKQGFAQIVHGGQVRWVTAAYLAEKKPVAAAAADAATTPSAEATAVAGTTPDTGASAGAATAAGVSSAPCPDGSGTESGLTSGAVRLFRGVCNAFPALSSYGGYDGHGEHSSGRAIDFMTSDAGLGQAVADWARAHASELDLYDVIWAQRIWTPVRSGEGWRSMPDRGSATANHFDHVHISVN